MWATCHYRSCDFLPTLGKTRPSDGWRVDGFTYEAAVSVTLITVLFVIRIAKWSSQRDQSHKKKQKTQRHLLSPTRAHARDLVTQSGKSRSQTLTAVISALMMMMMMKMMLLNSTCRHTLQSVFFFFTFPCLFHIWKVHLKVSGCESFRVWTTLLKCERGISSVSMGSIISECW